MTAEANGDRIYTSDPEFPDGVKRFGVIYQNHPERPWKVFGVVDTRTGATLLGPQKSDGRVHAERVAKAAESLHEIASALGFVIDLWMAQ